jgi:hypothetical protein
VQSYLITLISYKPREIERPMLGWECPMGHGWMLPLP